MSFDSGKGATMSCFMKDFPRCDSLIFDLDGTLWDTVAQCTRAWNEAMVEASVEREALSEQDMASIMGMTEEELKDVLFPGIEAAKLDPMVREAFRKECSILASEGGCAYPSVLSGLSVLSKNYPLFIVSNCQAQYLDAFFRWSEMKEYFSDSECIGRSGLPKGQNIVNIVERNGLQNPIYVGDTLGDERAARFAGLPFVFVTYGFGEAEMPDYRVDSFQELLDCLKAMQTI